MNITVIGSGYVGLVSGACLADLGNDVVCMDVNQQKIDLLNSGGLPIYEPGLDEVIKRNLAARRLRFTSNIDESVAHGLVQMIAVGTPSGEDGSADLQYVLAAARAIGQRMSEYKVIVTKSTVPVGTADKVKQVILEELAKRGLAPSAAGSGKARETALEFSVASNPEFLKEGAAIDDFNRPDRIVVGAEDDQAIQVLRRLYAPIQRNHERLIVMDIRSAELTKYAANAMLATRISFMNELANLAEKVGADIENVRKGIGSDQRIGYHFLYAGCGYGGSCFPKDVRALQRTSETLGFPLKVLQAVEDVNNAQKSILLHKVTQRFGHDLKGKHFALWGLAFKPGTDDMREATSRVVMEGLWAQGATVTAYDPVAKEETQRIYQSHLHEKASIPSSELPPAAHRQLRATTARANLTFAENPLDALDQADALIIVTEWKAFKSPDFEAIKIKLKNPIIFDGRNLFEPADIKAMGIEYHGIGRGLS